MPRQPFDMLRACFWLLAVVIGFVLLGMMLTTLGCIYGVLVGVAPPGTCLKLGIVELFHDWWAEILTAVLALIAARGPSPPPPPPKDE